MGSLGLGFKPASFWCFLQPGLAVLHWAGGYHQSGSAAPTSSHTSVREVTSLQIWTLFCSAKAPSPHYRTGAELATALSYLMKRCDYLCFVIREGVVL